MIVDISRVPEKLDATWLKNFFKSRFGIPVRVQSSKSYLTVWIQCDQEAVSRDTLRYDHSFPFESLGQLCLREVYPDHESLHDHWCGNVGSHSISMYRHEWDVVLRKLVEVESDAVINN